MPLQRLTSFFDAEVIEAELGEAVCVEWVVNVAQQDIEEIDSFNEQVKFTIDCNNIEQLEKLQTKLNVSGKKISYEDFLIKAAL